MEHIYKPTNAELLEVRNIKIAHTIFLKIIEDTLKQVSNNNKSIFRRIPDSRLKTTKSILNKFNSIKNKNRNFIEFVKSLNDIAGLRMTITTKDEFEIAQSILVSSTGLKKYGNLDTKSRTYNGIMNERGYAAHHYFLTYKINMNDELHNTLIDQTLKKAGVERKDISDSYSVTCEIQVRTLAQDLWAVFEHPERYKGGGVISETLNKELYNYARLMDVADDIAQLTKNRKILAAETYFAKKKTAPKGSKTLLDFKKLKNEVDKYLVKFETQGSISTFNLCELLIQLANHGVFTIEDFVDLVNNHEYTNLINKIFIELNTNRKEMDIPIIDSFTLLFICRTCEIDCDNIQSSSTDCKDEIENRQMECYEELKNKIIEIKSEWDFAFELEKSEV